MVNSNGSDSEVICEISIDPLGFSRIRTDHLRRLLRAAEAADMLSRTVGDTFGTTEEWQLLRAVQAACADIPAAIEIYTDATIDGGSVEC